MWVGSWDNQNQILVVCCCHETGPKPVLFVISFVLSLSLSLFFLSQKNLFKKKNKYKAEKFGFDT
jgi:hypothetical protein